MSSVTDEPEQDGQRDEWLTCLLGKHGFIKKGDNIHMTTIIDENHLLKSLKHFLHKTKQPKLNKSTQSVWAREEDNLVQ